MLQKVKELNYINDKIKLLNSERERIIKELKEEAKDGGIQRLKEDEKEAQRC